MHTDSDGFHAVIVFVANYCYNKYVGHYEHPSDQTCYVVCNDFGHGFSHRCARGTKWKRYGNSGSPSGYNRCA